METTNLKVRYSKEVKRFPWVLYVHLERRNWFSRLCKTRGANFISFQFFMCHFTIGMPWIKDVLVGKLRDYNSLNSAKSTNESFLSKGILIGNYKHLNEREEARTPKESANMQACIKS